MNQKFNTKNKKRAATHRHSGVAHVLALSFSIATQILEILPIVPKKKCVRHGILLSFFTEYRYSYLRLESIVYKWS